MVQVENYTVSLAEEDYLDVRLYFHDKTLFKFALNYRAKIKGVFKEIYHVDNFHGFLHEQKFWRTRQPIPIYAEGKTLNDMRRAYVHHIMTHFEKYKDYYKKAMEKK